jgi:hypothetical protein
LPCSFLQQYSLLDTLLHPLATRVTIAAQAVTQAYADGVDALVFTPPTRGADATPEQLAAAQAATEAVVKVQANKQVGGQCSHKVESTCASCFNLVTLARFQPCRNSTQLGCFNPPETVVSTL